MASNHFAIANPNHHAPATIRPAVSLQEAVDIWWELVRQLKWNCHTNDALSILASCGGLANFLVASETPDSPAVGCIIPSIYPNSTGWIGYFCLKPTYQGRGWGTAMFAAALQKLRDAGTQFIGLDAVPQFVAMYERRGFRTAGLVHMHNFEGDLSEHVHQIVADLSSKITTDSDIVSIREIDPELLVQYDKSVTGLERRSLWMTTEAFAQRPDAYGYVYIDRASNILRGQIHIRASEEGWYISSLYASSFERAKLLLAKAMVTFKKHHADLIAQGKVHIYAKGEPNLDADVWGGNPQSMKLFEEMGWTHTSSYNRMWINDNPTPEQRENGTASNNMWVILDAGLG